MYYDYIHGYLRWESLCGSFLILSVDFLAVITCAYTPTLRFEDLSIAWISNLQHLQIGGIATPANSRWY